MCGSWPRREEPEEPAAVARKGDGPKGGERDKSSAGRWRGGCDGCGAEQVLVVVVVVVGVDVVVS